MLGKLGDDTIRKWVDKTQVKLIMTDETTVHTEGYKEQNARDLKRNRNKSQDSTEIHVS